MKIKVLALAASGIGLSGGDRIATQFVRYWSKYGEIEVITWQEGIKMYKNQGIKKKENILITDLKIEKSFFVWTYIKRIISGILWAFRQSYNEPVIIYSASEFWMDSLTALILKIKNKKCIWAASWYQTAPNPFKGFSDGDRKNKYRISALLYWIAQLPIKPLIASYADYVLVNNDLEINHFPVHARRNKTIVVLGAVDIKSIDEWKKKHRKTAKVYDAVFQGRFHPQKGVVELIKIWHLVVGKIPSARLVLIGDGPLRKEVNNEIDRLKLRKNVSLTGYLFDGMKKYRTFSRSRIVLHPSFYDSGGMASAEAMAFGLPVIGFDLHSYKSYYPHGMLKVPTGNIEAFADKVTVLLMDKKRLSKLGNLAKAEIYKNWSWDHRSREVLIKILNR